MLASMRICRAPSVLPAGPWLISFWHGAPGEERSQVGPTRKLPFESVAPLLFLLHSPFPLRTRLLSRRTQPRIHRRTRRRRRKKTSDLQSTGPLRPPPPRTTPRPPPPTTSRCRRRDRSAPRPRRALRRPAAAPLERRRRRAPEPSRAPRRRSLSEPTWRKVSGRRRLVQAGRVGGARSTSKSTGGVGFRV